MGTFDILTFRNQDVEEKIFEQKIKMVANCSRLRFGTVDTSLAPVRHSYIEILKKKFDLKMKMVPNRIGRRNGTFDILTFRNRDVEKKKFKRKKWMQTVEGSV